MSIKSKSLKESILRNRPYFEDLITRSVYHSNSIEGNTISYAETYALIFNDNSLKINASAREIYGAINLKYALSYDFNNVDKDIRIDTIKRIGRLINKNINEIDGFRKENVFIRGAEHIPPKASEVIRLLNEAIYEYNKSKSTETFNDIAKLHIAFERIHPFSDGNGRTGRVLILQQLIRCREAPVVIPVEVRAQYMRYLAECNIEGLTGMFIELSKNEKDRMRKFGISIE